MRRIAAPWVFRYPILCAAAAYGLLVYCTLPPGVAVLNDDFGYLRSVVETLQRGRPWTNDWLEPWAASLSVLAALLFEATGSFHVATQGLQAVAAAAAVAGAAALWRDRGLSPAKSAAAGLLLVSFPSVMWKSVEFTGLVLYLPCLLWAIWAAGRRKWGVFFLVWMVACASRQSAVAWLVLPAYACVAKSSLAGQWRRAGWVLIGAAGWLMVLHGFMNQTQSQAMLPDRWTERLVAGYSGPALLMGIAILLGAAGLGRFILATARPDSATDRAHPLRVLAVLAATAGVLGMLFRNAPLLFEHASFQGVTGSLYVALLGALAIAGWISVRGSLRWDLVLAGAASLGLVALRPWVWDYYYLDAAILALAAGRLRAADATTPTTCPVSTDAWTRGVGLGCCLVCGSCQVYFLWQTKCRVDRESFECRLAESALRSGTLDVAELSGLTHGFMGWHLHPYYLAHEGRESAAIGGFLNYLRAGAVEVRRSRMRFWRDSKSLRPIDAEEAPRLLASEVTRVGWFWYQRSSLLRSLDGGRPAPRAIDRARYRAKPFPLNDREWRVLVATGTIP